jgi:hypothetical protein
MAEESHRHIGKDILTQGFIQVKELPFIYGKDIWVSGRGQSITIKGMYAGEELLLYL